MMVVSPSSNLKLVQPGFCNAHIVFSFLTSSTSHAPPGKTSIEHVASWPFQLCQLLLGGRNNHSVWKHPEWLPQQPWGDLLSPPPQLPGSRWLATAALRRSAISTPTATWDWTVTASIILKHVLDIPGHRWTLYVWQSLFPSKAWFTFTIVQHCGNEKQRLKKRHSFPQDSPLMPVASIVLCYPWVWLILVLTEHQNKGRKSMVVRHMKIKRRPAILPWLIMCYSDHVTFLVPSCHVAPCPKSWAEMDQHRHCSKTSGLYPTARGE